jgi:quinol monooxygenase YgiN
MYGTVAKFTIKPGKYNELAAIMDQRGGQIPGLTFEHVYQTDEDPNTIYVVVGFESKDAYTKNAADPKQHESYVAYRALLEKDPEWHDGTIIQSAHHG